MKKLLFGMVATLMMMAWPIGTAVAAPASTTYHLCQYRAQAECAYGSAGNQVSLKASDWSALTIIHTQSGYVEFQNGAGHCMYENGSHQIYYGHHACNGYSYEEWIEVPVLGSHNAFSYVNVDYNNELRVHCLETGCVFTAGGASGYYTLWVRK